MSVSPTLQPSGGLEAALTADLRDESAPVAKRFDVRDIDWKAVIAHPLTIPGVLAFVGLILAFLPMIVSLIPRWRQDEYYSHGFLVPFLAAFIVVRRWPKIQAMTRGGVAAQPKRGTAVKVLVGLGIVVWTWLMMGVTYGLLSGSTGFAASLLVGVPLFLFIVVACGALYGGGIVLANRVIGFQPTALSIILAMFPLMYVSYVGSILVVQSALFVVVAILAVSVVAGWKWALALTPAIAYLLFGLPVWNSFIDGYTNPLQLWSTTVAYQILEALQYGPYQADPTSILVGSFILNVAVPCSGMKLMLAVSAFTTLFVLIGNLKTWANALMLLMIIPLCLFVNGLRIALIGIVGAEKNAEAAMKFHDYSGYITLVVCFFLLFKFARILGWKD